VPGLYNLHWDENTQLKKPMGEFQFIRYIKHSRVEMADCQYLIDEAVELTAQLFRFKCLILECLFELGNLFSFVNHSGLL
jgi:UDP-N-acetylglucosamine 2-epimerase